MLFNNSKLRDKQRQMLYTYLLFQFLSVSLKVPRLSVCFVVGLLSSWTAVTQTHLQTQLRRRRRRKRSASVECSSSGCAACNVMSLWKYSEEVKCIYCSGFFCATIILQEITGFCSELVIFFFSVLRENASNHHYKFPPDRSTCAYSLFTFPLNSTACICLILTKSY